MDYDSQYPSSSNTSAVQRLPDMTGKTRSVVEKALQGMGFQKTTKPTAGGYEQWKHPDGSEVWIRPNGELVRLAPKVWSANHTHKYHPRVGPNGQIREPSEPHSTGEIIRLEL